MVAAGLAVPDFAASLELLRRLDRTAESARAALGEFVEILGAGKNFLEIGLKEIYDRDSFDLPIFPLEGAIEVLTDLSRQHQVALVTAGLPDRQMLKLKKAGIDSRIFSKIVVVEDRIKKPHYQTLVEELGYSPTDVLVCGDRPRIDLTPAKELGFKTVQMQWGRGLSGPQLRSDVDYTISALSELKGIINSLITFSAFN
jgi:FMN phosphatase YigB (HAD superfamily)